MAGFMLFYIQGLTYRVMSYIQDLFILKGYFFGATMGN